MSRLQKDELAGWVYDETRNYYSGLGIPERPVNPPEPQEIDLVLAEQSLRKSLRLFQKSPYWDDFTQMFFEEITDEEADSVVTDLLSNDRFQTPAISTVSIMAKVRERTYKKFAEQFAKELCS